MVTNPCIHFTHFWRVLSVRAFEGNDRFHNVPTSYEKNLPLPMVGWWKPPPQDPSAPTCPDVGSVYPFDIPDKTHINSLNVHQLRKIAGYNPMHSLYTFLEGSICEGL